MTYDEEAKFDLLKEKCSHLKNVGVLKRTARFIIYRRAEALSVGWPWLVNEIITNTYKEG